MKQYLNKHVLTIMLFYFLCLMTCLSLTLHKKLLNLPEKMFQHLRWLRKNFIPGNFSWGIAAEIWDGSCFKKGLPEKQQSISNTCTILPLKKNLLELNRYIFQIPLKHIKLVISKIFSLSCYYAVLIFTSKLHDSRPPSRRPTI